MVMMMFSYDRSVVLLKMTGLMAMIFVSTLLLPVNVVNYTYGTPKMVHLFM